MPILEVLYTADEPLDVEDRRAFAQEAVEIFNEVLGTPPGRLQIVIQHLEPEEGTELLKSPATGEE